MKSLNVLVLGLISFWSMMLLASPAQLTYQGRILKSDGTPLEYNNVSFIFQITDPQGSCVIYQEAVTGYNMVNSGGVFDLPIGNGTINFPVIASFSVLDAFNNTSTYNCGSCSGYTCANGSSSYAASSGDARKLRVQFYDGSGWKTISPDAVVRSVPFAGYAESAQKLGTNSASDFVLKTGIPTCGAGTFLTWDGTQLTCGAVSGASGGTVTNVTSTNSYLTIINNTSTPTLTLNVGTSSNTVAAGNDARFSDARIPTGNAGGDLGGTYPNPSVIKIQGKDVDSTAPTSGQFLKFDGAKYTPVTLAIGDISNLSADLASYLTQSAFNSYVSSAGCSTSQTMYWNSVSGNFQCQAINVGLAGDVTGSIGSAKVVALQNQPVDTTAPTSNQVLQWNGSKWAPATLPAGNPGTVTSVTGTAPISVATGTSTPVISISQATSSTNGYLSSADWTTFNNKQAAGNYVTALTGDVTASGPGSAAATVAKLQGSTLTITTPASGDYVRYNGSAFVNSPLQASDLNGTLPASSLPAFTGDVTSSAGSTTLTLAAAGTAGTYYKVTTDSKGRVTSGSISLVASDIPNLDWSKITTGKPTTLSGYGITDSLVRNGGGVATISSGADASKPVSPATGDLYVATDTQKIYRYNGASWDLMSSAAGSGGTITGVAAGMGLTGGGTSGSVTVTLANTAVTAGSYGSATQVPTITVDAQGRLTAASNTTITPAWSSVTSKPTTLAGYGITDSLVSNAGGTPSIQTGTDASKPASPSAGAIYFATDTNKIYQYNSGAWGVIASASGSGGTITALTSDVSASGSGSVAATVNSVGGSTAANIHSAETAANAATNANTVSTIVKRDASGNFSAGTITASLTGAASLNVLKAGDSMSGNLSFGANVGNVYTAGSGSNTVTVEGPSGAVTTSYVLRLPTVQGTANQLMINDGSGNLSWTSLSSLGVSSVSVTSPITNSGSASAPNIGIQQATTSQSGYLSNTDWNTFNNKQSTSLNSANIWVGNGSNVATAVAPSGDVTMTNAGAFTVTALRGKNISTTAPSTAGQVLRYDGTNWTPNFVSMFDLRSTITGSQAFGGVGCTAGQTLTWTAATDNLSCTSIAITGSQVTYSSQTANTFFAAPNGSSGAPTFRTIASADLPAGTLSGSGTAGYLPYYSAASTLANSPVYTSGSNVGIGSTNLAGVFTAVGRTDLGLGYTIANGNGAGGTTNATNIWSPTIETTSSYAPETALRIDRSSDHSSRYSSTFDIQIGSYASSYGASSQVNFVLANGNTYTPEVNVMSLLANGNVGIGTSSPVTKLHVGVAPTASANYSLFALGSGAFDGSTSGYFTGNANGTVIGINAASGYIGDLVNYQIGGSSKFKIDYLGNLTYSGTTTLSGNTTSTGNYSTSGNIATTGTGTITAAGALLANAGTASTSPTTGSLIVTGGAGVSGALNVGGAVTSNGNISTAPSTAATSGANQSSPYIYLTANYWNGSTSAVDQWSIQNILGSGTNPTSTLQFVHAGTSGSTQYAFINGSVGIGTSSPSDLLNISQANGSAGVTVTNTSSSSSQTPGFTVKNYSGSASGSPTLLLQSARGTSTSATAISSGDSLGQILFQGLYTGSSYTAGAQIYAQAAESWTSSTAGTNLIFNTIKAGSTSNSETMRIDLNGRLGIGASSVNNLLQVGPNGSQSSKYGVYVGSYYSAAGQAQYVGNWTGSGFWGIGPATNASDNTIRIGNTSDQQGTWSGTQNLNLLIGGNIGVGTTTPYTSLHVTRDIADTDVTNGYGQVVLSGATTQTKRLIAGYNTTSNYGYVQANTFGSTWDNLVLEPKGGNVGVGTTSPSYALDVNGTGHFANGIQGTTTNDNAAAGAIGEFLRSTPGAVTALTSSTITNGGSITLTPGDWDVTASAYYTGTGTSPAIAWVSAGVSSSPTSYSYGFPPTSAPESTTVSWPNSSIGTGSWTSVQSGTVRISVSASTTYYVLLQANFSGGVSANGTIRARRAR